MKIILFFFLSFLTSITTVEPPAIHVIDLNTIIPNTSRVEAVDLNSAFDICEKKNYNEAQTTEYFRLFCLNRTVYFSGKIETYLNGCGSESVKGEKLDPMGGAYMFSAFSKKGSINNRLYRLHFGPFKSRADTDLSDIDFNNNEYVEVWGILYFHPDIQYRNGISDKPMFYISNGEVKNEKGKSIKLSILTDGLGWTHRSKTEEKYITHNSADILCNLIKDNNVYTRLKTIQTISYNGRFLKTLNPNKKYGEFISDEIYSPLVLNALKNDVFPEVRAASASLLGLCSSSSRAVISPLISSLNEDKNDSVRANATLSLAMLNGEESIDVLMKLLEDKSCIVQENAFVGLSLLGKKEHQSKIDTFSNESKIRIINLLSCRLNVMPFLEKFSSDNDDNVKKIAIDIIAKTREYEESMKMQTDYLKKYRDLKKKREENP